MTNLRHKHEPLIYITKRTDIPKLKSLLITCAGFVAALVVSSLFLILFTGLGPIEVFSKMFEGTFGSEITRMPSIHRVAILLCISLAVTPAFKMKFWNIGAEGQVLMGGLAAAYCMLTYGNTLEEPVLITMIIVSGIVVGMIWALIPAICKAIWNTNETLFTLMMNYVAMTLVSYFIVVKDRSGRKDLGIINERTEYGHLPEIFDEPYLLNILIVVLVLIVIAVYLNYSKQGYEISVVGESENTARYIGINVKKVIIRTMLISGAICGLAGVMIVAGDQHSIKSDIVGGLGFTAIMVSWMSKFNPLTMVLVSALIIFLGDGGKSATSVLKADNSVGDVLTAIIIFFIIGVEFFTRYKINFRNAKKKEAK